MRPIEKSLKWLRFVSSVLGVAGIAIGQWFKGGDVAWQKDFADELFWLGVILILLSGTVLMMFERNNFSLLQIIKKNEYNIMTLEGSIKYHSNRDEFFLNWLNVVKLLSEITDQALIHNVISEQEQCRLYDGAVEIISEYRSALFGMRDEYINIAIYRFEPADELLKCVSCYRSKQSDACKAHREWSVGEGHVGKAFVLQRELICGDANSPDVQPWISAPPEKTDEQDEERYVSLAAVPIALNATEPLGVLIITSSEKFRFANSDEDAIELVQRERIGMSIAALQDFAAQIAQTMYVIESRVQPREQAGDAA